MTSLKQFVIEILAFTIEGDYFASVVAQISKN
jgi:hypothetical protein